MVHFELNAIYLRMRHWGLWDPKQQSRKGTVNKTQGLIITVWKDLMKQSIFPQILLLIPYKHRCKWINEYSLWNTHRSLVFSQALFRATLIDQALLNSQFYLVRRCWLFFFITAALTADPAAKFYSNKLVLITYCFYSNIFHIDLFHRCSTSLNVATNG